MSLFDEIKESFLEIIAVFSLLNTIIAITEFLDYFAELTKALPSNPTPEQSMTYLFGVLWFWIPRLVSGAIISIIIGWVIHKVREFMGH